MEIVIVWLAIWMAPEGECFKYCSDHAHLVSTQVYQDEESCLAAMEPLKGSCVEIAQRKAEK